MDQAVAERFEDETGQAADAPLLPIIREHLNNGMVRRNKTVIGLWPDRIVIGRMSAGVRLPAFPEGTTADDLLAAVSWRGRVTDLRPEEVEQIICANSLGETHFRLRPVGAKLIKFAIPAIDAKQIVVGFDAICPGRVPTGVLVLAKLVKDDNERIERAKRNRKLASINRPPFMSRPLGLALKGAGLAMLIGGILLFWLGFHFTQDKFSMGGDYALAGLSLLLIGNMTFRGGRRLAAPSFDAVRDRDPRKPIVFLRSFDSEDVETPTPGVTRKERVASRLFNRIPFAGWALDAFLFCLQFIYSLRGSYAERVEEQIGFAVARIGPMVAIGRPGERIATPGAARAYVSDDNWQGFILEMLDQAALVLIQVEETAGTWWEFEQCVQRVAPERLLIMLTAHYGSASAYEQLRDKARGILPHPLPINVGDAAFLSFDDQWLTTPLPLAFRAPFLRSLWPSVVNYRRSLAPVIDRIH